MGNQGKVTDHVLFLGEDVLEQLIVNLLRIDLELSNCCKKITDMVYYSGVDKGFVHLENIRLNLWDVNDGKTIVDSFKVVMEHVQFHSLDERMDLAEKYTNILLPFF